MTESCHHIRRTVEIPIKSLLSFQEFHNNTFNVFYIYQVTPYGHALMHLDQRSAAHPDLEFLAGTSGFVETKRLQPDSHDWGKQHATDLGETI